ncbi:MAG TPA: DUF2851 family protein [Chloroflexota bacterium]|nr:DUF2851 family protein [Chloroflexota bacterium]
MDGSIDERVVADAWERQAFDRSALVSLGLNVVSRGLPSDAGGPDYQDAILASSDRSLIQGDVEFHVRSSDWYVHRHHEDSRYDNVILHVVWDVDTAETVTADGRLVPTLAVGGKGPAALSPLTGCAEGIRGLSPELVIERIRACGRRRFDERRERFIADLSSLSANQVVYRALLESLGHAANRNAFAALAEAVPYDWLRTVPPAERRAYLSEAAGLSATGLPVPGRLAPDAWRLVRLRPANHPARRIAGFAVLLARLEPSPSETLHRLVVEAARPADLRRPFLVPRFVGTGRVDEIVASTVLPFVAAYDDASPAAAVFETYPAPPYTRWTRLMIERFATRGVDISARTAIEHQGLHWLYHRHCRFERVTRCPVCSGN